ncbi:MAG: DNA primase [Bacteroidetes bacterium]|nr:DNA primase [Bacteroidota bacterium]
MIPKATVESIVETARIDEVVGDFVNLRKRGSTLVGLCPFHNERSPSFAVSPSKGIYKCFGCGKAGDSVNFVMEHEHYTYPEALRYLANKYNIEIVEEIKTDEQKIADLEKESLYAINDFAAKFYHQNLETTEGQAIGKAYFYERGFTDATIEKFQLGYSPDAWSTFTDEATKNAYNISNLEKAGLTIIKEDKKYDRFRGRVMFPIYNLTGRTIAFGARILKTDPHQPKYVNSPESDIYKKNKSLYGINFAKKSITVNDTCYLCEGYTDVISLHQAGIENSVSSSGTSLTVDQIKLIARYTQNITVLYDGDAAGIKASMRGIDMILQEGLNVRIVLFPDGDDPDSYSKKVSTEELKLFLTDSARDFILFKTELLLSEAGNDPLRKAALIKDIVESISKIPDAIIRATYTKQCAIAMEIDEQVLLIELNKLRSKSAQQTHRDNETAIEETQQIPIAEEIPQTEDKAFYQEQEVMRLILNYGDHNIVIGDDNIDIQPYKVVDFIVSELMGDEISFDDELLAQMLNLCHEIYASKKTFHVDLFTKQQDDMALREKAIGLITTQYTLSEGWEQRGIFTRTEDKHLRHAVLSALYTLKMKKVMQMLKETGLELKTAFDDGNDYDDIMLKYQQLESIKMELSKYLSIVIVK